MELLAVQGIFSKNLLNSLPLRLTEDLGLGDTEILAIEENGVFGSGENERFF